MPVSAFDKTILPVIETMYDPVVLLNMRHRIIFANNSFCSQFRLKKADIQERTIYEISDKWLGSPEFRNLLHSLSAEVPVIESQKIRCTYGKTGTLQILVNAREIKIGKKDKHLLVTFREISRERREKPRNDFHRFDLDRIQDAIVVIDNDSEIVYVNKSAEKMYDIPQGDAYGCKIEDFYEYKWLYPQDERLSYESLEKTGVWAGINIHIKKNGDQLTVRSSVIALNDNQGCRIGMMALIRDITEPRKEYQELLDKLNLSELNVMEQNKELLQMNRKLQQEIINRKISEDYLRDTTVILENIFDTSHINIVYLDADFNFVRVNRAYAESCGFDENFLIGKNHFDLFPHEENEKIFREVVETGEAHTFFAKPFVFPQYPERGITYWDWTLSPVRNADGTVEALIFLLVDVTERIQAQNRLLESERARTEAVQLMERTTRLASIGEVSAGITHEINQPLNAIKLTVDGILFWYKTHQGMVPKKFIEMLDKISMSVERINGIIGHMSSFWGKEIHIETEKVDLNDVIKKALSLSDRQLSSHQITVKLDLCEKAASIKGIPIHLEQIVINLVNNSMHALDKSSQKNKHITINTIAEDDTIIMQVIDNGTGFPEGMEDKIFDPFFTTKQPGEGSGLGLPLVKRFVDELKGSISFGNNPTGGAYFTIRFPRKFP